jgi:K+-transporting ATPase KdpF subunit
MLSLTVLAGALSVGLLAYLVFALLFPEKLP